MYRYLISTAVAVLISFSSISTASACEWKIQITDKKTNEQKFYQVPRDGKTVYFNAKMSNKSDLAKCFANVEVLTGDKLSADIRQRLSVREEAILSCSYSGSKQVFGSLAMHLISKSGVERGFPSHMYLFDKKDIERFWIMLNCE